MTLYSMDYWETKLAFCEVISVAFLVCILKKRAEIVKQHFSVNALQTTLTYIHKVCADKKNVNVSSVYFCQGTYLFITCHDHTATYGNKSSMYYTLIYWELKL
jgi:hypothetical protein